MKVLLDATAIPADRGGVGRYLDGLVPALVARAVEVVVACQPEDAAEFEAAGATPRPIRGIRGRAARLLWEQVGLPRLARREHADVLHCPHYTMPRWPGVPVVVTLHDATFFTHPHLHLATKSRFFTAATRTAVRRAAALVTPSKATRDEVLRETGSGEASDRFFIAPHGVDATRFHPADAAEKARVAAHLGVDGAYVAFLGTLEPRKNVPALIRAWVSVSRAREDRPALVLAGGKGWDDAIEAAVRDVPLELSLLRPGYLPIEDLAGLLAGAAVVAYPSLGEGFGLPVAEAMACGATVLTTRELALPEVGGDAVAYCDTDEESIARALTALLDDAHLREGLGRRAAARAAQFTWDSAAAAHEDAYRAAIAR